ncbi:MepB family protein [Psychrobacter urativorans]
MTRTIRFRAAKITPTKVGQFVTFWEKVLVIPISKTAIGLFF